MARGRGAEHRTHRRPSATEERLRALGRHLPELPPEEVEPIAHERARHVVRRVVVSALVTVIVVLVAVQWFRPVPSPEFQSALTSVRLPGGAPPLPWPAAGSAALSVVGAGTLGQSGSPGPVPVGGLAKVMSALVVLDDHPFRPGEGGPTISVSASDVAVYQAALADQQSVVPVAAGETLNEEQALEALLVASGNNIGTLLATWDAGGVPGFVAKMNATVHHLGLASTTFDDPSGVSTGSRSTPADLIRLGEAAMAIPAFREIVAQPQVTLPVGGTFYNLDSALGRDGFVGIKTGSGAAAGGCFLFEASRSLPGKTITVVGVVLGQQAVPQTPTAVREADGIVRAAFGALGSLPAVAPGANIGQIVAPWGPSAVVTAVSVPTLFGWPGLSVPARADVAAPTGGLPRGARVGALRITLGDQHLEVPLRTTAAITGPSVLWRLTRL